MPAYLIANVEVTDAEIMKSYMAATPELIEKYSGKFLVRGGDFWIAEGDWNPQRVVVVEFPTMELAKGFYHSEEYKRLIELRQSAANTQMIFVDGV
ncbi:MAG: DUF1330 domain-containing protein [Bacteroidales bacterium]|nr:DUF1330 domain-containing protein [Bacteroidales bacterium]